MERSRKRSSSAGSEKMERAGDRQNKMEGHCSTGQSPRGAVAPMEEEEGKKDEGKKEEEEEEEEEEVHGETAFCGPQLSVV
jgi:hypothetical protein